MYYSLSGTAANGMPVNRVIEGDSEAAVRAYAEANQITVHAIKPNQRRGLSDEARSAAMTPEQARLGTNAVMCLFLGVILLTCRFVGASFLFQHRGYDPGVPSHFWSIWVAFVFFLLGLGNAYWIAQRLQRKFEERMAELDAKLNQR